MAKKKKTAIPVRQTIGLLLNQVLPGVGTGLGGDFHKGLVQLVAYLISLPLILVFYVGVPLSIAVWGWAFLTSIRQIREAK